MVGEVGLTGIMLLLAASYMDELKRKVVFAVPACLFLSGYVFRVFHRTLTLPSWTFFVSAAFFLSIAIEKQGGWTRGDSWIFVSATAALPKLWMYNGVIPVFLAYLSGVMAFNALLSHLYRNNTQGVPGIHSHTATYTLITITLLV